MIINGNSIRGIFKYSEDVYFEKDDFVVDGNCIYICTSGTPIIGIKPSLDTEHLYYSEYPGNKIVSASEYYDYVSSVERGLQAEDKYVSAHSLCEILENMYFGFGDNGILYDHILYNPNTGIEYSIRGVKEVLDYSTRDVLDMVIRNNDLNNGFIKVSRNLPEIRNIFMDDNFDSDVIVLKQYTYLDSSNSVPYRVQELMDPEKNKLYFRFAKGQVLESGERDFSDVIVSNWKNLYYDNEDAINKLNSLENYYQYRLNEVDEKLGKICRKFCYRIVEPTELNQIPSATVFLEPGEFKDIKSLSSFDSEPCILNILVKTQIGFDPVVYKNYTVTIDVLDAYLAPEDYSEEYVVSDNLILTSTFDTSLGTQRLILSVNNGIIKDIYYRDYYTLEHVHEWTHIPGIPATCTESGTETLVCNICNTTLENQPTSPLGHDTVGTHHDYLAPTCVNSGYHEHWQCNRCGLYFHDSSGINAFSGWDTGNDPVVIPAEGGEHDLIHGEPTEPNCISTGNREYWHCERCGAYFHDSNASTQFSGWDTGGDPVVIPIDPNAHDWGEWIVTIQPSCGVTGEEKRTCNRCGAEETRPLSGGNHTLVYSDGSAATCGEYGVIKHWHCSVCGENFLDAEGTIIAGSDDLIEYPTGNHRFKGAFSDIDTLVESTYTDESDMYHPYPTHGIGLKTCLDCGNLIEVQLPFKQHVFSGFSDVVPGAAFADESGKHYPAYEQGMCDGVVRRNYAFEEDIPIDLQLANHKVTHIDASPGTPGNYTEATCSEYGYWKGTCTLCGREDVIERDWIHPPLGHTIDLSNPNEVDWIPNDCTTPAKWVGKCTVCDDRGEMDDIYHGIIGHRDEDEDSVCDKCNRNLDCI